MINPYMQNAGAGGMPNQMNVGMAGVAEGSPMFGGMGAMGSQMQQPMFGNSSMNRSPLGGMGEQRANDEYLPIPWEPGFYFSPEGHRYRKKGTHYQPADALPVPTGEMLFGIPFLHEGIPLEDMIDDAVGGPGVIGTQIYNLIKHDPMRALEYYEFINPEGAQEVKRQIYENMPDMPSFNPLNFLK
mgnify:FL=1